jgi:hypothetical protein
MSLWIAVVALAVVPGDGSSLADAPTPSVVAQQQPLVPPRNGRELQDAVRAAMRRWARVSGKEADLAARDFLALYHELQADDQLARAQRQDLGTKVRSRLLKLSEQIKKRVAVEKRLAKNRQPESVDAAATGGVLAQVGGFGRQGGFAMPGFGRPAVGGGMMGGGPFGGGGQYSYDHGQELVELIQQIIAPHTWDVNGGLGSIYYWRPHRALIIRQTGEVHDQIGGVLEQLNRAGR